MILKGSTMRGMYMGPIGATSIPTLELDSGRRSGPYTFGPVPERHLPALVDSGLGRIYQNASTSLLSLGRVESLVRHAS